MSETILTHWRDYPMGPVVRRYLGIDDDVYLGASQPGTQRDEDFEKFMARYLQQNPIESPDMATTMAEEFLGMGQPYLALVLASVYEDSALDHEFRWHFALGNAAHMSGDDQLAESYWRDAHRLIPDEPAPYVNLAELMFHQERDNEALEWSLACLEVDVNNTRIWETIAAIFQSRDATDVGSRLHQLAEERGSWAGVSLAALITDPDDRMLRAQRLQALYDGGLREGPFLVEFTAALGVALQYEKIPALLWQAEKDSRTRLPWQLYAHGAQAQLALNERAGAAKWLTRALADSDLPAQARPELESLLQESLDAQPHQHTQES